MYDIKKWRHIFKLRTAKAAHPTVQSIMKKVLAEFKKHIPLIFDDIAVEGWVKSIKKPRFGRAFLSVGLKKIDTKDLVNISYKAEIKG